MKVRITASAPVRWAKWPAQPTRIVGRILNPGEELILDEKDVKWHRFVVAGDGGQAQTVLMTECIQ